MEFGFDEFILAAWLYSIKKIKGKTPRQFFDAVKDCFPPTVDTEKLFNTVLAEKDEDIYTHIISYADSISSGFADDEGADTGFSPLSAVLSCLHLDGKPKPEEAFFGLEELSGEAVMPKKGIRLSQADYDRFYGQFIGAFKNLKGLAYNDFLPAMESLLEHYWRCIPACSGDTSVSLFQHAKMRTAFAGALYRYHSQNGSLDDTSLSDEKLQKFMFINGDMSGIQKYIFDLRIPTDNAKLLRARSFQLWALSEVIAQYLVKEFELSSANIITTAGGKFLIVVQNTEKTAQTLNAAQIKFETYFLREFAGTLSFILSDGVKTSVHDLKKNNVQVLINEIGYNAECCKQKKMQKALKNQHEIFDALYDTLQVKGACTFCETFPAEETNDGKPICKACKGLIGIGEGLVKTHTIRFFPEKLKEDAPFTELVKIREKDAEGAAVINDFIAGKPVVYLPYTAPKRDGNTLLSFEQIAERAAGNKKLAMFKADVDNLGLLFTSSFSGGISFSKYAEMSRTLHYFFSAYLAQFIDEHYKNKIYTVFSGGDDVCVLGAWNDIMDFACDFRDELQRLTHNNPSVTLSAGIALVPSSLPVRNIAEEAESQLDESKARTNETHKIVKDAVTVFGTTVSWDDYKTYLEYGKRLVLYMDKGVEDKKGHAEKLSTGAVYKLIDFADREKKVKKGIIRELVWLSNFRYMTARNIKNEEIKKLFLTFGTSETIEKSRISASYALYAQRNNAKEEHNEQ